jgi:anaerobic selenocysteine-containing dehydrogenase
VVLPSAFWGEKTGTFTNHDRTVHLSEQAVDPPGEARADMDILRDYAARLGLRDRDGAPLVKWSTPEAAFDAFARMTKGRPCDYSGLSYEKLRGSPGIQWPCNDDAPDGTERLYTDFRFHTDPDDCEDYGHDFVTGAAFERMDRAVLDPRGRAILRAAEYHPPSEMPDDDYPLRLTTGRTVYQFHTRTKTGRVRALRDAAPEPWVELSVLDAEALGIADGDRVRVVSRRGAVEALAQVRGERDGVVFVPFHYGYWDESPDGAGPDGAPRAANELTITEWDPVSKQPLFKVAAVRVERIGAGSAAGPDRESDR